MKTVTLKESTWKNLMFLKLKDDYDSIDDLINYLMKGRDEIKCSERKRKSKIVLQ